MPFAPIQRMTRSFGFALVLVLFGCAGSAGQDAANERAVNSDPLVGTWTFSGRVPALVDVTLTVNSDETLELTENIAPPTTPVGGLPEGCITTNTLSADYAEAASSGADTFTWTFTGGTSNEISECSDASLNSAGTSMTDEAVAAYLEQGLVPPTTVTYTVTSTTLTLNPTLTNAGGLRGSTTFMKQ